MYTTSTPAVQLLQQRIHYIHALAHSARSACACHTPIIKKEIKNARKLQNNIHTKNVLIILHNVCTRHTHTHTVQT